MDHGEVRRSGAVRTRAASRPRCLSDERVIAGEGRSSACALAWLNEAGWPGRPAIRFGSPDAGWPAQPRPAGPRPRIERR